MNYLKYITLFVVFAVASCKTPEGLSRNGQAEKDLVSDFLTDMKAGKISKLKAYMSPKYMKRANPPENSEVNTYMIDGFEIEGYDRKYGYVTALVWGTGKFWMHRLTFQVVSEKDKLYLWSEDKEFEYAFIDPWIHTETYINEDKDNK